jgi:redox-sensitive bicupin YhaK (pirin superfamily)
MKKNIIKLEHPRQSHMVGDWFRVSQYIPGYSSEMNNSTSPFLMLDYNAPWTIPPQRDHRPWVGFHPHRGFETVTVVYSGEIEHQDTAGHGGVIWADEVQWMTAGSGLLHNEFMTAEFARMGGIQHAVQLWVNLPKKDKMTTPRYQALTRENIPEVSFEWGRVRVIAWDFRWIRWAAETFSPVELYDIRFDTSWELDFAIPELFTTMILVTEGEIIINGKLVENGDMVHLSATWTDISMQSSANAKVLVMSWEPLWEPIAHYGPFVMNTQEEIMQAFKDLNTGKMGNLN